MFVTLRLRRINIHSPFKTGEFNLLFRHDLQPNTNTDCSIVRRDGLQFVFNVYTRNRTATSHPLSGAECNVSERKANVTNCSAVFSPSRIQTRPPAGVNAPLCSLTRNENSGSIVLQLMIIAIIDSLFYF